MAPKKKFKKKKKKVLEKNGELVFELDLKDKEWLQLELKWNWGEGEEEFSFFFTFFTFLGNPPLKIPKSKLQPLQSSSHHEHLPTVLLTR